MTAMTKNGNTTGVPFAQRRYSLAAATPTPTQNVRVPYADTRTYYYVNAAPTNAAYGHVEVSVLRQGDGVAADRAPQPTPSGFTQGFAPGTPRYLAGTVLRLKAVASASGRFAGWADGVAAAERTVTVSADSHFKARFEAARQIHTVTARCRRAYGRLSAIGMVESAGSADSGVTYMGNISVEAGDSVAITATPNAGYEFDGWVVETRGSNNITGLTDPTVRFSVAGPARLFARFVPTGGGQTPSPDVPQGGDPEPQPYVVPQGGDPEPQPHVVPQPSDVPTAKAAGFVRRWWWALLILGYLAYKEWKGGRR